MIYILVITEIIFVHRKEAEVKLCFQNCVDSAMIRIALSEMKTCTFPKRRNCSGDEAVRAILHQTLFSLLIKGILCGFRQIFMHISFPSIEKSQKKVTKQDVTIEQAFQTSPVSLSSSFFHFFLRRIEPPFT